MIRYEQFSIEEEVLNIIRNFELWDCRYSANWYLVENPNVSSLKIEHKVWIAFIDDKAIGICCVLNYLEKNYISTYVKPEHRKKNIGTELVNRVCNSLRKEDFVMCSEKAFYNKTNFMSCE